MKNWLSRRKSVTKPIWTVLATERSRFNLSKPYPEQTKILFLCFLKCSIFRFQYLLLYVFGGKMIFLQLSILNSEREDFPYPATVVNAPATVVNMLILYNTNIAHFNRFLILYKQNHLLVENKRVQLTCLSLRLSNQLQSRLIPHCHLFLVDLRSRQIAFPLLWKLIHRFDRTLKLIPRLHFIWINATVSAS